MAKLKLNSLMRSMRMGADGLVRVSDVVVPEIFTPSVQLETQQKSRLIQSGVVVVLAELNAFLLGGGTTFTMPHFQDLDNDEENISSDEQDDRFTGGSNNSSPKKLGTGIETAVRMSRNQSWSTSDLSAALTDRDPAGAIASRVAAYWTRRLQVAFIATMNGVFASNALAPTNGSTHTQNDMTNDISGSAYAAGTTDFSAPAFLDALVTMGDSQEDLGLVMVHSIVYNRMQKNQLIDFIPDATGATNVPTFLGRTVVVDDGMPNTAGVYETWIFGSGTFGMGAGAPKVPTETRRDPDSGNGAGSEILYNRLEWILHPRGYRYAGTVANGGPSNAATANNLAAAATWVRTFRERKQIKIARLITREFA